MAFQDFDQITERRRLERKQALQRRIILGIVVVVLILSAAIVAFLIFLNNAQQDEADKVAHLDNSDSNNQNKDTTSGFSAEELNKDQKILQTQKAVQTVCESTDYKETCESHIEKSLGTDLSGIPEPEDLINAAINAASVELNKAIEQTFKVVRDESAPEKKAIHDVCKQVLEDAQDDFNRSRNAAVDGTADLDSWLSAVIAYQQTCIDAITEKGTRAYVMEVLKTAKELTSNSLAIVSSFDKGAEPPASTNWGILSRFTESELPIWMTHETRRLLKADAPRQIPNATVAKDGSGDFFTISKALERIPEKYEGRYVIHIKAGVYDENVVVTKKMVKVTMYGDGSQKTIVTGKKNFVDGVPTFQTATFAAIGESFIAKSIGFRNTAGPEKHQAVALRVQSDRSVFLNCRMEGYQDTLYAQTHRQFYRGCRIIGTIDFIFGDAAAVFQRCEILIRKPMKNQKNQKNTVTAQGRSDKRQTTGTVLQKCKITADSSLEPEKSRIESYLGRPWKEFSRTIVMESEIGDVIRSDGWLPWEGNFALQTLYYAEYNNIGPGSQVKNRVKWPGYQTGFKREEAIKYTVSQFIQGESWLKGTKVPVRLGFYS